jgi:hypothetical protein
VKGYVPVYLLNTSLLENSIEYGRVDIAKVLITITSVTKPELSESSSSNDDTTSSDDYDRSASDDHDSSPSLSDSSSSEDSCYRDYSEDYEEEKKLGITSTNPVLLCICKGRLECLKTFHKLHTNYFTESIARCNLIKKVYENKDPSSRLSILKFLFVELRFNPCKEYNNYKTNITVQELELLMELDIHILDITSKPSLLNKLKEYGNISPMVRNKISNVHSNTTSKSLSTRKNVCRSSSDEDSSDGSDSSSNSDYCDRNINTVDKCVACGNFKNLADLCKEQGTSTTKLTKIVLRSSIRSLTDNDIYYLNDAGVRFVDRLVFKCKYKGIRALNFLGYSTRHMHYDLLINSHIIEGIVMFCDFVRLERDWKVNLNEDEYFVTDHIRRVARNHKIGTIDRYTFNLSEFSEFVISGKYESALKELNKYHGNWELPYSDWVYRIPGELLTHSKVKKGSRAHMSFLQRKLLMGIGYDAEEDLVNWITLACNFKIRYKCIFIPEDRDSIEISNNKTQEIIVIPKSSLNTIYGGLDMFSSNGVALETADEMRQRRKELLN